MTTPLISTESRPRIAIVGVGTMGSAMARRLLAADFSVTVWTRQPENASSLFKRGAVICVDPRSAVAKADVVITMLATPDATRNVMIEMQALAAMQANATWAQMGTIGVDATRSLLGPVRRFVPTSSSWTPQCREVANRPKTANW